MNKYEITMLKVAGKGYIGSPHFLRWLNNFLKNPPAARTRYPYRKQYVQLLSVRPARVIPRGPETIGIEVGFKPKNNE